MKQLFVTLFTGLGIFCSQAQNIEQVRFLTQDDLGGSARFQALSGAFGALGGDLSSIMVNPAASSVFQYNEIGGSIGFFNISNKASYFGTETTNDDLQLELNQLGAVIVLENTGNGPWKKLAFGVNAQMKSSFAARWILEYSIYPGTRLSLVTTYRRLPSSSSFSCIVLQCRGSPSLPMQLSADAAGRRAQSLPPL